MCDAADGAVCGFTAVAHPPLHGGCNQLPAALFRELANPHQQHGPAWSYPIAPDGNSSDSNHQGSWAVAYVCTTGAAARMHARFRPQIIPSSGSGLGSKQKVTLLPPPLTDI